ILPLFSVLARLKGLRGTAFDPFGYTADRRFERRAITEYEQLMAEVLTNFDAGNHSIAVELASLPQQVRGYGHVKLRQYEAARKREADLLQALRTPHDEAVAA